MGEAGKKERMGALGTPTPVVTETVRRLMKRSGLRTE
jgi:hypothetical protein